MEPYVAPSESYPTAYDAELSGLSSSDLPDQRSAPVYIEKQEPCADASSGSFDAVRNGYNELQAYQFHHFQLAPQRPLLFRTHTTPAPAGNLAGFNLGSADIASCTGPWPMSNGLATPDFNAHLCFDVHPEGSSYSAITGVKAPFDRKDSGAVCSRSMLSPSISPTAERWPPACMLPEKHPPSPRADRSSLAPPHTSTRGKKRRQSGDYMGEKVKRGRSTSPSSPPESSSPPDSMLTSPATIYPVQAALDAPPRQPHTQGQHTHTLRFSSHGQVQAHTHPQPPRLPHNQVERKYREGLNAEMDRLRRAIPTLPHLAADRTDDAEAKGEGGDGGDDGGGGGRGHGDSGAGAAGPSGASGAKKAGARPSKAVVLASAVDYIKRLEAEAGRLRGENEALKAKGVGVVGVELGLGLGGGGKKRAKVKGGPW